MCNEKVCAFLRSEILSVPFKYSMPKNMPAYNNCVPNGNKCVAYEDNDVPQRIKKYIA